MTEQLGTVRNHGFDETGHERRERVDAIVECPVCGNEVALWSDTEEWKRGDDLRWHHSRYAGCAMGECCGKILVDTFDGSFVLDL